MGAVLQGAASVDAEVLVLPDLCCEENGNDAASAGSAFGRMLHGYPYSFSEVVVCGSSEFYSAACQAAGSRYNIMCRQPIVIPEKLCNSSVKIGLRGSFSSRRIHRRQGSNTGNLALPCGCVHGISMLFRTFEMRVRDA